MLNFMTKYMIQFIEHELVKNAPVIEAELIAQLERLAKNIMDYVDKLENPIEPATIEE